MAADRMKQLEHAVMDLGTEVFRLKQQVTEVTEHHERFLKTVKGLRHMLDERGVIVLEDFDAAIDLGEAAEFGQSMHDSGMAMELEKLKKMSH